MRRGILGGTFDPPHLAHLVAGEAAYRQLGLDMVSFLPAGAPWQKAGREVSAATHRWEMTRRAVAGVAYFEPDDREVRRDGWTYTVDTLTTYPDDTELVLVLGADAAAGLRSWKDPDGILERASIAVMRRPGSDLDAVRDAVGDVAVLDTPELAVSGTMLRRRRAEGRSIRFLVREAVHDYLVAQDLYRSEGPASAGAG
ncbi:MAG: nicotinate-nucleotide adenylyltransferase [Acidimicrobiia bacterium]|nr:nicotinate-nucleotide adenylyltransferase [Acidimicrobiia bacterium]